MAEPGFDPAWAPDGKSILYVSANYLAGTSPLRLDSDSVRPASWDQLRVWDVETGEVRNLNFRNLSHGSGFIQCPLWLDADQVAFFASGLRNLRPDPVGTQREWTDLMEYRRLSPDGVVIGDLTSGRGRLLVSSRQCVQIERLSNGAIAVWDAHTAEGDQYELNIRMVASDGRLLGTEHIPAGRWGSPTGAVGTVIPPYPVMVEQNLPHEFGDRVVVMEGDEVHELYASPGMVTGVYASPEGQRLACVERTGPPGSPYRIMVLAVDGGQPAVVTTGVYVHSRIAWSPDGRRIAYARSKDGHIAIAEVPPLP